MYHLEVILVVGNERLDQREEQKESKCVDSPPSFVREMDRRGYVYKRCGDFTLELRMSQEVLIFIETASEDIEVRLVSQRNPERRYYQQNEESR